MIGRVLGSKALLKTQVLREAPLTGGARGSDSGFQRRMAEPTRAVSGTGGSGGGGEAPKKVVLVVAVALMEGRRVLLAQRPPGRAMAGLWEFPGGKIDPGEVPEAALVRELREELGIEVAPEDLRPLTFASHAYENFHLLMPLYECRRWSGAPRALEGQALAWAPAEEVASYAMPAADVPLIEPVARALARDV
ncbi:MAG: NUDIX hydrolase domain-like protein [Monoraphidium minutum]|nr:MAG: NUDIX hydrolase domain-like protein [Monoraphidium minutum]